MDRVHKNVIISFVIVLILLGATAAVANTLETAQTATTSDALEESQSTDSEKEQQKDIALVEAGQLDTAYASWWQNSTDEDDTYALQSAFDSNASQIVIENIGRTWISKPLFIRKDNKTIFFEQDVIIEAKRGEFHGVEDALFFIKGVDSITMKGQGDVILQMHREDYRDPEQYAKAEWRHGIRISQSTHVYVEGFTIRETGGDGVYIGEVNGTVSENITLSNIISEYNYRQGLSITNGRNILVKNSSFNYTEGTNPMAGVDIEPNTPSGTIDNIVFENCEMMGNQSVGIAINLHKLNERSKECFITLNNVRLKENIYAEGTITAPPNYSAGGYVVLNNVTMTGKNGNAYLIQVVPSELFIDFNNTMLLLNEEANHYGVLSRQLTPVVQGNVNFNGLLVKSNSNNNDKIFLHELKTENGGNFPSYTGRISVEKSTGETWDFGMEDYITKYEAEPAFVKEIVFTDTTQRMSLGEEFRFRGKISGTGRITQRISWSIEGGVSPKTTIDSRGILNIGEGESSKIIKVIGTSVSDHNVIMVQEVRIHDEDEGVEETISPSKGGTATTPERVKESTSETKETPQMIESKAEETWMLEVESQVPEVVVQEGGSLKPMLDSGIGFKKKVESHESASELVEEDSMEYLVQEIGVAKEGTQEEMAEEIEENPETTVAEEPLIATPKGHSMGKSLIPMLIILSIAGLSLFLYWKKVRMKC